MVEDDVRNTKFLNQDFGFTALNLLCVDLVYCTVESPYILDFVHFTIINFFFPVIFWLIWIKITTKLLGRYRSY